jgi:hypothetical protein
MWWPWRPPFHLRKVIVNLKDDPSTALEGVIWSTRGAWYVLRDAQVLTRESGVLKPISGELIVERANVLYFEMQ